MKRLAMVLTVAFTMGLAASTVSAATKDDTKKATTQCCSKSKDCSKDKKACCSGEKKAETPAKK